MGHSSEGGEGHPEKGLLCQCLLNRVVLQVGSGLKTGFFPKKKLPH